MALMIGLGMGGSLAEDVGRQRLSLDGQWAFLEGDVPFPVVNGHGSSYTNAKAGTATGAAAPGFDDTDWRMVDLPHDWAVEQPFDKQANISQGYRQRGIGWYRRHFKLDPADRGKHLELQFDGVATHCTVWVNGMVAHRNFCGYTSFGIDITPFARFGDEVNTIAVRVDAVAQEGWWYEGAGIYRHVWLMKRSDVHITTDGVYANPVKTADGAWEVPVEVTLGSSARQVADVEVESILIDPDGREVVRRSARSRVEPFGLPVARLSLPVAGPGLWSVDRPTLYTVRTVVRNAEGKVLDEVQTRCGFRTLRFDPKLGFFLNDQPLKIKGVCNHQDHAGVGVAVPDSLWEFRIRRLKEMGANAYRCAHNPPAAEFLDACDRMGLLVLNESRNFNTTDEYVRQLQWLVRRDRNRPSVFMWSVFNEEPMQGSEQGFEMVRKLVAVVKQLDSTRPVTAAQSGALLRDVNASLAADVAGFNYCHRDYDAYHERFPDRAMTSTEDTSAVMTRGVYETDKARCLLDSYDQQFQSWGRTHREAWKLIDERPFVAGSFVWTGFDYRGEPQPLSWPAASSSFGIMDLCGFPKTAFYIHQARWMRDKPMLKLVPHWNWPNAVGKTVKVMPVTNAESVELLLNGKSLGSKAIDKYMFATWEVPYEAGRLEAIGTSGGQVVARDVVETTGDPVRLVLVADRQKMSGDGRDALPITVGAVDASGREVPTANLPVTFSLTGPGKIIGLGNGDPTCHEPEKGNRRSLFNGLAQVIVQSQEGASGSLMLQAAAGGLESAAVTIEIDPTAPVAAVPPAKRPFGISRWRMSPATEERPDANQEIGATDMNTWTEIRSGQLHEFVKGRFAVLRATVNPPAAIAKAGGTLCLMGVQGKAWVYVDGQLVVTKESVERADVLVPLPPGTSGKPISVLIETGTGTKAGLGGAAEFR